MKVNRRPARRLSAAAFVLSVMAAVLAVAPTSALSCAREWGGDTFAGAQQAVAQPARWDGLVVGTIAAVERKNDYWRTRVLIVEPGVVFAGDLRDTVRVEIGGHGPEMAFAEGAAYFLPVHRSVDPNNPGWFVDPCGPTMEMTSGDQLAQLRAISDSEIVISEPVITGTPAIVWAIVAAAAIALVGVWIMRRPGPMLPAAG